jgi:hypothetical protein
MDPRLRGMTDKGGCSLTMSTLERIVERIKSTGQRDRPVLQFSNLLTFLPIPYGVLAIVALGLIIAGTFVVISRRDLTTVEGIGLLLLVWAIPIIGVAAVMLYLWMHARRRI